MELITITEQDLYQAMLTWETAAREGQTLTQETSRQMPTTVVAQLGAGYLWGELKKLCIRDCK